MFLWFLLLAASICPIWAVEELSGFSPKHHIKAFAMCPAVKRDANDTVVDIKLTYADINPTAKSAIIMVHGWPSLWSSWGYQIMEFKKDYRLIVPDLRGFGESTHPDDVKTSGTMYDLAGDLICILQNAGIANALCMGHDWGTQLCYEATRMRPDIFHGVIGITIPYIPASGPFIPLQHLTERFPTLRYQIFFDSQTSEAVAELDKDIKRTVRATLRTVDSPPPKEFLKSEKTFLGAWDHISEIPPIPFFSEEEEEYFIEQYSIQGFRNTLQFYTHGNRYASWKFANDQDNHTIPVPVLAIYPTSDPVADWIETENILGSAKFLPFLTRLTVHGAHWVHMENPKLVNSIISSWLKKVEELKPEPSNTVSKVYDEEAGTTKLATDATETKDRVADEL